MAVLPEYLQDSNSSIQFDVAGKLAATDREQKGKCVTSTLHTGDVALKGTTYRVTGIICGVAVAVIYSTVSLLCHLLAVFQETVPFKKDIIVP